MYDIHFTRQAEKQLRTLEKADRQAAARVTIAIVGLAENPRPPKCIKLKDRPGWRIRVGIYRILYEIDDTDITIDVFRISSRGSAYKD
ncbi:type II toxin-antitoxin system RelE family toxin [Stackebrandtia soli]|uniref:type II toxin-antitoxin system RelE family toxin n=1 Tax=Stackebrandtia soli TaxID=1892856 RepID=UPI0039EAEEC4